MTDLRARAEELLTENADADRPDPRRRSTRSAPCSRARRKAVGDVAAMPLRFYLCASCRDTWTGTMRDRFCHFCGEVAPGVTMAQAVMEARYVDQRSMRRSLYRGIVARGNTSCRGVAR